VSLNSRAKGARGELELAEALNALGMFARRTVQYSGKSGDAADVVVDGICLHIEVKRTQQVRLRDWIAQATRDAKGRPWIIFHRSNRSGWLVIQSIDQWAADSDTAKAAIAVRRAVIERATHEVLQA
jgi:Holliday junction resolvase